MESTLTSDATVLSFIAAILLLVLGIAGYFIDHWIKTTEGRDITREEATQKREDAMNLVLHNLNETLTDVNLNLKVYQASMDGTLHSIKTNVDRQSNCIDKHDITIQDHEIRLTVIERR